MKCPVITPCCRLLGVAGLLLGCLGTSFAKQPESRAIPMTRIEGGGDRLAFDGELNEPFWSELPVVDDMRVVNPDTMAPAPLSTEVRVFYDAEALYVGVRAHQDPETLVARLSARDTRRIRDAIVLGVDASGEGLFGFFLRVNLGGALTDGTLLPERQIGLDWDGPWDGRTAQLDDGWSAEVVIPWSMMALPNESGESRRIGLYFEREVGHLNENWSWPALPQTNPDFISAFQPYQLDNISSGGQFTFYPFASNTTDVIERDTDYKVGTDLYWRPNSNTQLSATLNPDFGTVETDDVVVNLGAFETFFSEKRNFFLEGQEVFFATPRARGGGPFGPTTMLNTRRIGQSPDFRISPDVEVDQVDRNRPTELLGAVKASGQIGNWRYGTLAASEDDTTIFGQREGDGSTVPIHASGRDYVIGRLLYEDTTGGGRRGLGWMGTHMERPGRRATVNGIDFHYFSADTRWVLDGQALHSDVNDVTGKGVFFDLEYRPRQGVEHSWTGTYFDDRLEINDVGFVQRNDHQQLDYSFSITESDLERFRSRTRSFTLINQWNTDGHPVRLGLFFGQNLTFHNNHNLDVNVRYLPPRTDDRLSRGNGTFEIPSRWWIITNWQSDPSRPLSFNVGIESNDETLGQSHLAYTAGIDWQPNDRFSMQLTATYRDREGWLVHQGNGRFTQHEATGWFPDLDIGYFLNADHQFQMRLQWTGIKAREDRFFEIRDPGRTRHLKPIAKPPEASGDFIVSRLNFQARYRWEIAPLSDLFIVYTRGSDLDPAQRLDGSFTDLLTDAWTNRIVDRLVVKLRYRLGI